MNNLQFYNTLSRKKEEFKSIESNKVKMYACGPTVYNYAHIGNLRTYIFEDVLKKTLQLAGYDVFHVMNITDVGHLTGDDDSGEDKIEKSARENKKSIDEIVDFYTKAFMDDLQSLNIQKPNVICKASEHVSDMIELIKKIEKNGHTYISNGNVYFSIDTIKDYGKLAKLKLDELQPGKRIAVDKFKKNPNDFVLWFTKSKFQNQIMKWDSPWGVGYPGWHIECSAMSMKYLGEQFDIHCGGADAVRVHHTNEIAQSEAATGKKWVNYWMHGEFLLSEKGKMSKSSGEFITLKSLADYGISPLAYRYFCLQSHYRKQLQFSLQALKGCQKSLENLYDKIGKIRESSQNLNLSADENNNFNIVKKQFEDSLYDDLSTLKALSIFNKTLNDNNCSNSVKIKLVELADSVFSLNLLKKKNGEYDNDIIPAEILHLAQERRKAKMQKDFVLADALRSEINKLGFQIKDTAQGYEILKNFDNSK